MVIEPTEFNVFGIRVKEENLLKIRSAMSRAYNQLMRTDRAPTWEDSEFCKRQIGSLWGGIVDMLSRLKMESSSEISSNDIKTLLIVDRDNWEFLTLFGKELEGNGAISDILEQMKEIEIEQGSLRVHFRDLLTQKRTTAEIEISKMLKRIRMESEKIKAGLKHFVNWIKENKRPVITCSLVAGLVVTSIVAICCIGIPVLGAKLFILASLAVICLIYEIYGAYSTFKEVRSALSRRLGLSLTS